MHSVFALKRIEKQLQIQEIALTLYFKVTDRYFPNIQISEEHDRDVLSTATQPDIGGPRRVDLLPDDDYGHRPLRILISCVFASVCSPLIIRQSTKNRLLRFHH